MCFSMEMVAMIANNPNTDINKTDCYGVNAFWLSAFYGHIDIMNFLVSKGIDKGSRNQNGSNALHIAVKKGDFRVIQALIELGFPLDQTKNNGVTATGIAAYKGGLKSLDMLYRAGANISKLSKQGISPLYLAIKANRIDCINYLVDKKAQVHFNGEFGEFSPLYFAISIDNVEAVEYICENAGLNLDSITNNNGFGLLTYAA